MGSQNGFANHSHFLVLVQVPTKFKGKPKNPHLAMGQKESDSYLIPIAAGLFCAAVAGQPLTRDVQIGRRCQCPRGCFHGKAREKGCKRGWAGFRASRFETHLILGIWDVVAPLLRRFSRGGVDFLRDMARISGSTGGFPGHKRCGRGCAT